MDQLIERYVYDVIRRLPEKEREEVKAELTANIYDMLSEEPGQEEIEKVLAELGDPAKLAVQYSQNTGYLISPAFYFDYIRTLKWIVPMIALIVGVVMMCVKVAEIIGMLGGNENTALLAKTVTSGMISAGIGGAVEGAVQAVIWVTIGFVIAEKTQVSKEAWNLKKLPEMPDVGSKPMSIADSIVELILPLVFFGILILWKMDVIGIFFSISGGTSAVHVLSDSFMNRFIVFVFVGVLFNTVKCSLQIYYGRFDKTVGMVQILDGIVGLAMLPYLFRANDLFHEEFIGFLRTKEWGEFDILRYLNSQNGEMGTVTAIVFGFFALAIFIEIGVALYKMIRLSIERKEA